MTQQWQCPACGAWVNAHRVKHYHTQLDAQRSPDYGEEGVYRMFVAGQAPRAYERKGGEAMREI